MSHTHPLYNVMVTDTDSAWPTMNDTSGLRSLNAALAACAKYAAAGTYGSLAYTVEPEHGTEPRYRILTTGGYYSGLLWPDAVESDWGGYKTHSWAEARKVYEAWSHRSYRAHRASLLVVQA